MNLVHSIGVRFMRRGLTLAEAAISLLIVSVMLVASLETVGATARARQIQEHSSERQAMAIQLMTEVFKAHYEEPQAGQLIYEHSGSTTIIEEPIPPLTPVFGPEADERDGTRRAFDDVDDYAGLTETPPRTRDGTALLDTTGWTWNVEVSYVNPKDLTLSGSDTGLKRITVNVTDDHGAQVRLVALRSKLSVFDQLPTVEMTRVSWLAFDLQVGADARSGVLSAAGGLVNEPTVVGAQ